MPVRRSTNTSSARFSPKLFTTFIRVRHPDTTQSITQATRYGESLYNDLQVDATAVSQHRTGSRTVSDSQKGIGVRCVALGTWDTRNFRGSLPTAGTLNKIASISDSPKTDGKREETHTRKAKTCEEEQGSTFQALHRAFLLTRSSILRVDWLLHRTGSARNTSRHR